MKLGRAQLTSVGLALLAVVTAFLVIATRERPTTSEKAERAGNLLPVWREDALRSVTLEAAERRWVLERGDAGGWTLRAPESEPADDAAADRLVAALGFATPARRVEAPDRSTLGLATPVAKLSVDMGATKYRLSLGKSAPAPAGAAYLAVEGDGVEPFVAVVEQRVVALFRTEPDDLRERLLVTIGARDLKELSVERRDGTLRIVRGKAQAFLIDGKARARRDTLEPVLGALSRLQASRFLAVPEAERARGGPAELVVRALSSEPKTPPVVVELGGACPGAVGETLAILREPRLRAACVKAETFAALRFPAEGLVDTMPFSARADEVETLRIERGQRKLVLTRKASAFRLREPSEAEVELEAGNQRLGAVLRAPAELMTHADPKRLGLDPPEGRVVATTIGERDAVVEEVLFLGRVDAEGVLYARRAEDGAVLAIGREAARAFAVDGTLLRSRRVLDFGLSALVELELSAPERQILRRSESGLELTLPPGFQHDGALATDAVLALGSLTALRWVADADDGSFGLATPTLSARARFEADAGAHERELVVGRPTPGGHYAKLRDDPGVFVVERVIVDRLSTLLIDRSALMADPDTLLRVTLTAKGTSRTLERRQGALVPAAGSEIDPAVASRLIEALGALRAEAALHTGAARPHEGLLPPALEVEFEPQSGFGKKRSFRIGAGDAWRGQAVRYARATGVNSTFAVADSKLRPLFDLF